MKEQMSAKSHSHTILIDIEAYLDMQVGWALQIRQELIEGKLDCKDFNYEYLINKEPPEIMQERNTNPDFLNTVLLGVSHEKAFVMYREMIEDPEDREEIIRLSPVVRSTDKIINIFSSPTGRQMGNAVVLVRNPGDGATLKFAHPKLPIVEEYETEKINFKRYARLIISDIDDVFRFPQIMYTHIAVLDYPRNFEVIDGKKVFKRYPILNFGATNEFEIIKPV